MPDAMLFQSHVLSSLCDLQLEHEFGEAPLTPEEHQRLTSLETLLPMLRPSLESAHPRGRPRSLVEVFQAALGCAECQAQSCPVKAMLVRRPKTIEGEIVH